MRLRLAGRTWYTPDFLAVQHISANEHMPPLFIFVEIKGFMRDDAAVKLKVAAETYPCFQWLLVRRAGRARLGRARGDLVRHRRRGEDRALDSRECLKCTGYPTAAA